MKNHQRTGTLGKLGKQLRKMYYILHPTSYEFPKSQQILFLRRVENVTYIV